MSDKRVAYTEWQLCAERVEAIVRDQSKPLWEKACQVGTCFSDIPLEELRSKHRHKILNGVMRVNAILARYDLKEWDDYQKMSDADLRQIVEIFRSLKPPKSR